MRASLQIITVHCDNLTIPLQQLDCRIGTDTPTFAASPDSPHISRQCRYVGSERPSLPLPVNCSHYSFRNLYGRRRIWSIPFLGYIAALIRARDGIPAGGNLPFLSVHIGFWVQHAATTYVTFNTVRHLSQHLRPLPCEVC